MSVQGNDSVLEQFPLLMRKLKEELKQEVVEELGAGQWVDQAHSVLGPNIHIRACKRLIRRQSTDAYYSPATGQWKMRASAVDEEIRRRNSEHAERLPKTEPPPPVPAPLAKAEAPVSTVPLETDDEDDGSAIYEREYLAKLRGGAR